MRSILGFFTLTLLVSAGETGAPAPAPQQAAQPVGSAFKIGSITIGGSLRTRMESWDWFQGDASNDYTFLGSLARLSLSQSRRDLDWQVELAAPVLLGLPGDAVAAGAQGQLGLGASYFVANHRHSNAAMVFAKQAYMRFKGIGGVDGQSLKVGRMEVIDGTEVAPKNATLATLKKDRIAHRLLGNFGFSDVGRSFDGVQYAINGSKLNVTLFGGRPTRGVFQVDGWGELNLNVFYGAVTGQTGNNRNLAEWRLFGLGYNDYRDGVLKTDNRLAATRKADLQHINIGTYGGHYLHMLALKPATIDFLFWGAVQTGSWGVQSHKAAAFAVEAGFQPNVAPKLRPWIRGGYNYASGDKNPKDSTHGTFFQILPTPRIYARMPFFNLMNSRDAFGELTIRPAKALAVRADVHSLSLANSNDLWYSGGGAFQPWTFGYTRRPSKGQSGLATLTDLSADYSLNAHVALGAYFGHANGGGVMRAIYPTNKNGNFGYLELTLKF